MSILRILVGSLLASLILCFGSSTSNEASAQGYVIDQVYLDVPFEWQETQVWCWVASARMIARYYNVTAPSQCEMLKEQYQSPCCLNPAYCSRPGHISEIQGLIANFGLRYSSIGGPVDGWTLLGIFKQGHPIVLHIDGSHFVVASGMRVVATPNGPLGVVRILDPLRGKYDLTLPELYLRWDSAVYVY